MAYDEPRFTREAVPVYSGVWPVPVWLLLSGGNWCLQNIARPPSVGVRFLLIGSWRRYVQNIAPALLAVGEHRAGIAAIEPLHYYGILSTPATIVFATLELLPKALRTPLQSCTPQCRNAVTVTTN